MFKNFYLRNEYESRKSVFRLSKSKILKFEIIVKKTNRKFR